jgi:hypothetical protein
MPQKALQNPHPVHIQHIWVGKADSHIGHASQLTVAHEGTRYLTRHQLSFTETKAEQMNMSCMRIDRELAVKT